MDCVFVVVFRCVGGNGFLVRIYITAVEATKRRAEIDHPSVAMPAAAASNFGSFTLAGGKKRTTPDKDSGRGVPATFTCAGSRWAGSGSAAFVMTRSALKVQTRTRLHSLPVARSLTRTFRVPHRSLHCTGQPHAKYRFAPFGSDVDLAPVRLDDLSCNEEPEAQMAVSASQIRHGASAQRVEQRR